MVISGVNTVTYNGDGITTAWPYTYEVTAASEIRIQLNNADGTAVLVDSDYYVDLINSTVYYPGYAPGSEPPEAEQPPKVQTGQTITVYREIPITQESDLGEKWPFEVIEKGLDKLTMIAQQIDSGTKRKLDDSLAAMELLADVVVDSDELQHITDQYNAIDANAAAAAESEANALAYKNAAAGSATAAATSATNAANSAVTVNTVATALTDIYNDAIDQGTIVAPAVDATLSVPGAAADAEVTGENIRGIYNQCDLETVASVSVTNSRALSNSGTFAYDTTSRIIQYNVNVKDILHLNIASRDTETYKVTWVFKDGNGTVIGSVHTGAIDNNVIVPTGATMLQVAELLTNTTNTVKRTMLPSQETQLEVLSKGSYESLKGGFDYGHIDADTGQPGTPNLKFAHSASLVSYDRDVVIYVKPIYRWWVHRYQSDGTWIGLTGGPFTYETPILIPQGIYFKLSFTTTTNIDIDIDDLKEDILVTAPLFSTYHISNANIKQIAHQGLRNAGYSTGGNLADSYRKAGLVGFTYGETDVAFTSDGVPVCIHDSSFVDETSLETVVIANTTYEDLLTHNYRQGQPISTFDEIVKTCKENGMGLFIDHLDVSFTNTQWQTLFDIVHKYAMQDKVFWTTTGEQIPNKVKTYFPDANFVVVINTQSGFASGLAVANAIKTDKNEVELSLNYTAFPANSLPSYISQMPPTITIDVWAVDDITTWKSYVPYVSGIVSNAICSNLARIVG